MDVKLQITTLDTQKLHSVTALLDTGCTRSSIDSNFVNNMESTLRNYMLQSLSIMQTDLITLVVQSQNTLNCMSKSKITQNG